MQIVKVVVVLIAFIYASTISAEDFSLRYEFTFVPEHQAVDVHISIPSQVWLNRAQFDLSGYDISRVKHNGKLQVDQNTAKWQPPKKDAFLKYRVKVNNQRRTSDTYDAYVDSRWALLRGEKLVPPVRISKRKGAEVSVTMRFILPANWPSVHTGWERLGDNVFAIDNPEYTFPRPAGWIIAGDLGTRHELLAQTQITVSAPQGHNFRQMEKLAFITLIWPHLVKAIDINTPKILVTGASEPMWRGGLSSPNSLYMHGERPLVSENGTSTLIHELFHVTSNISSNHASDWIVEGLAEYYAVEILYRAGGFTSVRRQQIFEGLRDWSKDVKALSSKRSTGTMTARAAVLFDELNKEIIDRSNNAYCLDHLVRRVQQYDKLTVHELAEAYKKLIGKDSRVLQTPLLAKAKKAYMEAG